MATGRKTLSRTLYWLGLLLMLGGIAVVLMGARTTGSNATAPKTWLIWAGFVLGLLGMAVTARGATLPRY